MKIYRFLFFSYFFSGITLAECSFVFPSMPFASVKAIYTAATDSERKQISNLSESSVSSIFALLSGANLAGNKRYKDALEYTDKNWRNNNLIAEYYYFKDVGSVSRVDLLKLASERKIESIILAEAYRINSANDAEIDILEPALLGILSNVNSQAFLAKAKIEKIKYPNNPYGYGLSSLMAVKQGHIDGLRFLPEFYTVSGCDNLSQLSKILWSAGSRGNQPGNNGAH